MARACILLIAIFSSFPSSPLQAQELVNNCCILGFSLNKPVLDTAALARVVEKIGDIRSSNKVGSQYRLKSGIEADYYFRFGFDSFDATQGKHATVVYDERMENWQYDASGRAYLYRIATGSLFSPGAATEVSNFITSAYMMETGAIRIDSAQYTWNLPLKDDGEFWKRNLISQGWGAQYIYSNNPYGKGGWLPIGFGYLTDAFTLTAVGVGILQPDIRPAERAGYLLSMVAFSAFFKVLVNGLVAKGHMNTYNRLVGSGYPIPKTHWTGLRKARFGRYLDEDIPIRKVTPSPLDAPDPDANPAKK